MSATESNVGSRTPIVIPPYLATSRLMRDLRGFSIYSDLPSCEICSQLRADALSVLRDAKHERRDRRVLPNTNTPDFCQDRTRNGRHANQEYSYAWWGTSVRD